MSSVTKHDYDSINCAKNKTNELVNSKKSSATTSNSIDSVFDWSKKDAIDQQRKLRWTQVRQQSKEIASQIRENVRDEKKRQLDEFNNIKQNELMKWRQKQIAQTENNYRSCLQKVGEAHLAAERENEKMGKIEEQRLKNRKLALQRGKIAAQQIKKKTGVVPKKDVVKEKPVVVASTQVVSSDTDSDSMSTSTSSASSVCSAIFVKSKAKSTANGPSINISPKKSEKKTKFAMHESPVPIDVGDYNAANFASLSSSTSTDISLGCSPINEAPAITRISDMLKRTSSTSISSNSVPSTSNQYITKTYKINKSPTKAKSYRTSPKRSILKSQAHSNIRPIPSSRPMNAVKMPLKNASKAPPNLSKSTEKTHYVPQFVKSNPPAGLRGHDSMEPPLQRQKVQFYDHANRFAKEYEGKMSLVKEIKESTPMNAWQEAQEEKEREQHYLRALAEARQMDQIRSEQALEKEKIRKDYELMSTQLSDIMKQEHFTKNFLQSNEIFSETRLKQIAEERQKLMNQDFRNLIKEPVLITCPKRNLNNTPHSIPPSEIRLSPSDLNVGTSVNRKHSTTENDLSSESSHSFLLDYVTTRTNNLTDDIDRCRTKATHETKSKIEGLTALLNKVNALRRILCEEIKQSENANRINADYILYEMDKVDQRQNEIMKTDVAGHQNIIVNDGGNFDGDEDKENMDEKTQRSLSEREQILQMKENRLEEKIRELYFREKKLKSQKQQQLVSVNTNLDKQNGDLAKNKGTTAAANSPADVPLHIVINVNKNDKTDKSSDKKNDPKWCERLRKSSAAKENFAKKEDKGSTSVPVSGRAGPVYRKTPAKLNAVAEVKSCDISSTPSTTHTTYMSPPENIHTELTKALQRSNIPDRKSQRPQDIVHKTPNSDLMHYIIRLMGMSRTSIEQLNTSSVSTVHTPSSSMVNVSGNQKFSSKSTSIMSSSSTSGQLPSLDEAKLNQLKQFIAENQNFLAEFNESIDHTKAEKETRAGINQQDDRVSGVWADILTKEKPTRQLNDTRKSKSEAKNVIAEKEVFNHPKTIMRKDHSSKPQHKNITDADPTNTDLISKYDELTANCTKRIINLDSMISKVREEKQKLLENTLSSAGSLINGQKENLTEYMDLPAAKQANNNRSDDATITLPSSNRSGESSHDSETKCTNTTPSSDFSVGGAGARVSNPISEHKIGLLATRDKQFGESKDSGVGNSRPVTSSDYRDSPDLRQQTTVSDMRNKSLARTAHSTCSETKKDKPMNDFEPLLKDIPKISYRIGNGNEYCQSEFPLQTAHQGVSFGKDKSTKPPPAALARYSPNMEEDLPHELSTIIEVDTPATSRLNATGDLTLGNESAMQMKNDSMKHAKERDIQFHYKHFPNFKEYAQSHGNLAQLSTTSVNESVDVTATASLILGEKLEKILEIGSSQSNALNYEPFHANHPLEINNVADVGDGEKSVVNGNSTTISNLNYKQFPAHAQYSKAIPGLLDSQSIEKLQSSDGEIADDSSSSSLPDIVSELKNRNILSKSFEMDSDMGASIEDLLKVNYLAKSDSTKPSGIKNQSNSFSESLEKDLHRLGIGWATSLLKKSKEANMISSSSTSSASLNHSQTPRRPTRKSSSPRKSQIGGKSSPAKLNMSKAKTGAGSFVDTSLTSAENTTQGTTVITQQTDCDAKAINLKDFLARELLKHSSMSSSSTDSSLASIFLKSFLGSSSGTLHKTAMTPQNRAVGDKQRTSTPVNHSNNGNGGGGESKIGPCNDSITKLPSAIEDNSNVEQKSDGFRSNCTAGDLTQKLFSGESRLSSVRVNTSDSETTSNDEQEKHKQFDNLMVPANLKLQLAAGLSTSSTLTSKSSNSS